MHMNNVYVTGLVKLINQMLYCHEIETQTQVGLKLVLTVKLIAYSTMKIEQEGQNETVSFCPITRCFILPRLHSTAAVVTIWIKACIKEITELQAYRLRSKLPAVKHPSVSRMTYC